MRSLFAFGLAVAVAAVFSTPASAQFGGRSTALGGGGGSRASNHPLGGFTPGRGGFGQGRFGQGYPGQGNRGQGYGGQGFRGQGYPGYGYGYGYPYAYSYLVPDYSTYSDAGSAPSGDASGQPPPGDAQAPPAPSQQPIIINQYFGAQTPPPDSPPQANTTGAPAPDNPADAPQNYYLIAYKSHEVYAALAYWVEDKTLNYVTPQNTHNQASLDLIDLPLTQSLNRSRDVPFTVPGQ